MSPTIQNSPLILLILTVIFFNSGCNSRYEYPVLQDLYADTELKDAGSGEDILFWNRVEPPKLTNSFIRKYEKELNISVWHTRAEGKNKPVGGELGSFGIGNGYVFGFVGDRKSTRLNSDLSG